MRGIEQIMAEGKKKPKKTVEIVEREQVAAEVLAKSIIEIAEAAQKLMSGPLTKRAVLVLIKDMVSGVPITHIEAVLDAAADLKKRYVR